MPRSGRIAHGSDRVAGMHQHYYYGASATMAINAGDVLYAYVYLDPVDVPSEMMLQWNDGSWEHRAYWGANQINWGADGTASRSFMGPLPPPGQWTRLEVPASAVELEGATLNGMAFTLFGGRATWNRAGKIPATPRRLQLSVNPYPVPLGSVVTVTVMATDSQTHAPIAGTVTIRDPFQSIQTFSTNTAFSYRFRTRVVRRRTPDGWEVDVIAPTGTVRAPGYPITEIDFGI